ncbi:lysophospholipid acyltransferase family protein [Methylocaldum sp.]|uniref:lysophospholipid acyltransferase family protein n=1 Tax=Methylocaldum sp. TaxID=1969727 RepID=UPI002D6A3DC0|nr:lysophospholipid acyltransferase family protein [Methylocaldum sp.]HYE37391.1 lysophospholipid acyltransferase family protein [Methylocaldum sp.]
MQRCRQWLKAALIAGMFLIGVATVGAVMPVLSRLLGRRAAAVNDAIVVNWNRAVCRILNLHVHIGGNPDPSARLVVANHISWLDIIALGAQGPCLFVAKREVADWPVMGYLAKGIGTLFIDRGDIAQTAAVAEQMAWQLRQGKRLVLFPEGTTTAGDRVLRFHGKLFHPAQLAGVRVQAVALRYGGAAKRCAPFVGEDEFLPHLIEILKLERIDLYLHYCCAVPSGVGRDELAQTTRKQIVAALDPEISSRRRRFAESRSVMNS